MKIIIYIFVDPHTGQALPDKWVWLIENSLIFNIKLRSLHNYTLSAIYNMDETSIYLICLLPLSKPNWH